MTASDDSSGVVEDRMPGSGGPTLPVPSVQRLVRLYQIGHHPHSWHGRSERLVLATLGTQPDALAWRKYLGSVHAVDALDGRNVSDVGFGPGGQVSVCTTEGTVHHFLEGWKPAAGLRDHHIRMVSYTESGCVMLTKEGDVLSTGSGACLGQKSELAESSEPVPIKSFFGVKVTAVAGGMHHIVALSEAGAVFSWGGNRHGQLGLGLPSNRVVSKPTMVTTIGTFFAVKIAAGGHHSALVESQGRVYTWGRGAYGRLGHDDENDCFEPVKVQSLHDVVIAEVACGGYHTLALTVGGAVLGWGLNDYGQVGSGSKQECCLGPQKCKALDGLALTIAAGEYHSAAITEQGRLYVWGSALCGQAGDANPGTLDSNIYGERAASLYTPRRVPVLSSSHLCRVFCGKHTVFVVEREPKETFWRVSDLDVPTAGPGTENMLGFALRSLMRGTTLLKYGRKGKPHPRYFKLTPDFQYIAWDSKAKKPAVSCVPLADVAELRLGQRTAVFSRFQPEEGQEKLSFSLIYTTAKGERTLDVVCPDEAVFRAWVVGIDTVRSATTSDPMSHVLRREFENAAALHGGSGVKHSEVSRFVQKLCDNIAPHFLQKRLHEHGARLRMSHEMWTWEEVLSFSNGLRFSEALRAVFDEFAGGKPYMSRDELHRFISKTQRESLSSGEVDNLIRRHERSHEAVCMHFTGFVHYARSRENSIRSLDQNTVVCDMTLPVTHYFISTYRPVVGTGSKAPTLRTYKRLLQSGCRCLDVVVVDGPIGMPRVVPHGHHHAKGGGEGSAGAGATGFKSTMVAGQGAAGSGDESSSDSEGGSEATSGIGAAGVDLQSFITVIRHYAFVKSPFPLFLSLKVACTVQQQQILADVLRRELSRLLYDGMSSGPAVDLSPQELRHRVVLIVNVVPPTTGNEEAASDREENWESDADDGFDGGDDDDDDSSIADPFQEGGFTGGQWVDDTARRVKYDVMVAKALADMSALAVQRGHAQVYASIATGKDTVLEISSKTAATLATRNPRSFTNHNKHKLCIVASSTSGRGSHANPDPAPLWACGVQMVAMDIGAGGAPSWSNRGMFASNGGCGYVLKPSVMRDTRVLFDPNTFIQVKKKYKITVLEGWQLPDPYHAKTGGTSGNWSSRLAVTQLLSVSLRVRGVAVDCMDRGSHVVESDGFNPVWNCAFTVNIALPDLALVSLVVYNSSPSYRGFQALTPAWGKPAGEVKAASERRIHLGDGETAERPTSTAVQGAKAEKKAVKGSAAAPLSHGSETMMNKGHAVVGHYEVLAGHLRPGLRSVPLFDSTNNPMPLAMLLVNVEIV